VRRDAARLGRTIDDRVIVSNVDAAFRVAGVPDHEVALPDRERRASSPPG
jgi:hypothetical protein